MSSRNDKVDKAISHLKDTLTISQLEKVSSRLGQIVNALNRVEAPSAIDHLASLVDRNALTLRLRDLLKNGRKLRPGYISRELGVDEASVMAILKSRNEFVHTAKGWWTAYDSDVPMPDGMEFDD